MNKGRQTILKLLSDGKITIEEAEELLDAIPNNNAHIGQELFGKKPPEYKQSGGSQGFNFDFHFPWDDPNWKWPWDREDWHWPWEMVHQSNEEHETNTEITHNILEGTSLVIKSDDGNLNIQGWDSDDVIKINSPNEDVSSEISDDNQTVYVSSEDADVSIMVPLRVISIQISGEDGNINLSNIRSDISLKIDDGNAMISDVEGKIFASVDDGNLALNDIHSNEIAVKANDGQVSLSMSPPVIEGTFNLRIDDGRLLVSLPADCACQITANVEDGVIRHNLSHVQADVLENDGVLNAKLNGGGAEFILSAGDGEIVINAGN